MRTKLLLVTAFFILNLSCHNIVYADATLEQAKQLIQDKQSQQAYDLLIAQLGEKAGTPDYDLLLGMAALRSGQPTQAVFAFERVLALQPDNVIARTELAKAYYEMGENEAAKLEFTSVKDKKLPESMSASIEQYLSAIEAKFAAQRTRIDVYIDGTFGYDSNVNSATDTSSVAIPALGNLVVTLDDSGRELDSGFFRLGAGTVFSTPFLGRKDIRLFGSASVHERITFNESDFRTRIANGLVGLRYKVGKNIYVASINGQKYYVGGDDNRDLGGASLQWLHNYSTRTQFSVFGQWSVQRFPDQTIRNLNQYSGGVGLVHALKRKGDPIIFGSVFAGTDEELNDLRPDLGRAFVGVRVGGQYSWNKKTNLIGGISYQYSRYGGEDSLFQERRKDHFVLLRAGLNYQLTDNWSIRPEIQYTHNDSSLPINEYDRWQTFVNVRNTF